MRALLSLVLIVCGVLVVLGGQGAPSALAQAQPPERPTLTPVPPTAAPVTAAPTHTPRPASDESPTDEPTATPQPTSTPTAAPTATAAPTSAPTATAAPTATVARPARLPRTAGADPAGLLWGLVGLALFGAGLALARRTA